MKAKLESLRRLAQDNYVRAGVATTLALSAIGAHAQETDPFADVIADVTAKVQDYAGALVILAGVGVVFMIAIKYVKKIRGAA